MDPIGAAAALPDRLDRMLFQEFAQISPGRGAACFGEADGFAQGHAAREALRFGIQQPIEQFLLPVVEAAVTVAPPESRLAPHCINHGAIGDRLCRELLQEPAQPSRDIEISSLAALQNFVIRLALARNLSRDAEGAGRQPLLNIGSAVLCQKPISDGTGQAAVAVFIGVEGTVIAFGAL